MTSQARLRVVASRDDSGPQTERERHRLYGRLPGGRAIAFLESLPDALYLLDSDWRFTFINRAAGEYWKRDRAGLIGKQIWQAFPQAAGSEDRKMHETAAARRRPVRFETVSPVLHTWIHVSIRPIDSGLGVCFRPIDGPGKRGRVLVVEDQDEVRDLLRMTLEQESYLVILAEDLDAAEAAVGLLPIDAVLLDDRLPGGRGASLFGPAARAGVNLLMMSGHPATIAEFNDDGNFIAKPFRLPALLDRLERLLKNSQ
ncbi:MAG TPA: response regulator [Alphaproteobacteria bacterium]